MSQTTKLSETLMGGISFLRDDLIGPTAKSVAPTKAKPSRPLEAIRLAVETQDREGLLEASERIAKPLSTISERKIVEALVEAHWPEEMADLLLDQGLLDHSMAIKVMRESGKWQGLLWMGRSEASIALAERKVGIPVTGAGDVKQQHRSLCAHFNNALSADPTLLETVAQLDVARILRKAEGGTWGNAHRGLDWITNLPVAPGNKAYVSMVQALFDPRVADSVWEGHTPQQIKENWANSSISLLGKLIYGGDLTAARNVEALLLASPHAAQAWKAFWESTRQNDPESAWPYSGKNNLAWQHMGHAWKGDGNLLGLLTRTSPKWVRELLTKEGALPDMLYEKIKEGHRAYWFVGGLDDDHTAMFNALSDRIGLEWRDPEGRCLGHVVAMAGPADRKTLSWLRNHPQVGSLLLTSDNEGKTALDVLRHSTRWASLAQETARVGREVLMAHAKETPRPVTRASKRSM